MPVPSTNGTKMNMALIDSNTDVYSSLHLCSRDLEECTFLLESSKALTKTNIKQQPIIKEIDVIPGWIWGVLGGGVLVSFLVGFVVGLK